MMKAKDTIATIFTKSVILLINFTLVILTTRFWGDEGRGFIALIVADVALIGIINNITSGATLTYHLPKYRHNIVLNTAYLGTLLSSLVAAFVFALLHGPSYYFYLFIIALLTSYASTIGFYYLSRKDIRLYNFYTILAPSLILISLLVIYYLIGYKDIKAYLWALIIAYGLSWIIGFAGIVTKVGYRIHFDSRAQKAIIYYGFKSELSYFIQFLNYRLSYFFISAWLGLKYLGIFSIAMALSEGLWVVSKSISALHYSRIINSNSPKEQLRLSDKAALSSLLISLVLMLGVALVPNMIFIRIFGPDFEEVKTLTLTLFPGILAIAVSNVWAHYFSGRGQMRVLLIKSITGLVFAFGFLMLFLKPYGLWGACISLNASYIASSAYLFYQYYRQKRKILKHT